MSYSPWIPLADRKPEVAGHYLVAFDNSVGYARYMPRLGVFRFPSAAMAFEPTHWMNLPPSPKLFAAKG